MQMAGAIQCMHSHNIMHRDVKGENFIFAQNPAQAAAQGNKNVVKLIDLGMSAEYDLKHPIQGMSAPGLTSPCWVCRHCVEHSCSQALACAFFNVCIVSQQGQTELRSLQALSLLQIGNAWGQG